MSYIPYKSSILTINLFNPKDIRTFPSWMFYLLQFWQERILDFNGGFFETIDANSNIISNTSRNTFVAARLTHTYSQAFHITNIASFKETAHHGFSYLTEKCQSPEGGWYKTISTDGIPICKIQDSYTQAFVLLAMASYFRAFQDSKAIKIADDTWNFIEEYLTDREYGGLLERYDPTDSSILLPRTQNASMHMLEAVQALYIATNDNVWLERANSLIEFSHKHFIDHHNGGTIEFLDKDWNEWKQPLSSSLAPDKSTASRQTGHVLERSKLMLEQFELTGDQTLLDDANRLYEFAKYGIETIGPLAGLVCDSLDSKGNKVNGTRSFWQCLELLALLSTREKILKENLSKQIQTVLTAIQKYFIRSDGVSWHNQIDAEGLPIGDGSSAARLLYHLGSAELRSA